MTCATLRLFTAALMVVFATAATASAQTNLVPNGDFETAAGADWITATGGSHSFSFPAAGGNGGGYGQIDQNAAGWGVLVSEAGPTEGLSLASLGLTAGNSYTFTLDMIDLTANGARGDSTFAGMKIESWGGGLNLDNSGDVVFGLTGSWDTYTFEYTVAAAATGVKFVPLLVGQPVGSSVGFDNVGVVVPEPTSLALFSLGVFGLVARRRRK